MIAGVAMIILGGMLVPVPRMHVPMSIQTVTLIDNDMRAPVGMGSGPFMEPRQPDRIAREPVIAGTQIKTLRPDDTDEFESVPDIGSRNRCRDYGRRGLHRHCGGWNSHGHDRS